MKRPFELPEKLWDRIEPILPVRRSVSGKRGRPVKTLDRDVLEGVFWILRTGAQWHQLPGCYPPRSTTHARFQELVRGGFFSQLVQTLGAELLSAGLLDVSECFIDGMFAPAKRGGQGVGKTKRGKGSKIMMLADAGGLPLGAHVSCASPHETKLVNSTLERRFVERLPIRLIGDGAYDSDWLDERLAGEGIELIAPHRCNRVKPVTQDGRVLRRYSRRWKIERLNAWLQNYRRLVTRFERILANFIAMLLFTCALILSRRL